MLIVKTIDGKEARLYSKTGSMPCQIHGAINYGTSKRAKWEQVSWTKKGHFFCDDDPCSSDLDGTEEEIKQWLKKGLLENEIMLELAFNKRLELKKQ